MLITIIYNNLEVATGQNYAEFLLGELELSCRDINQSRTPRITTAYQYGPSCMLLTIAYGNLETATGQNYAELSSRELELSCRAFKKSKTHRRTLAYHDRTSDMLIKMIYNNLEVAAGRNYAEPS